MAIARREFLLTAVAASFGAAARGCADSPPPGAPPAPTSTSAGSSAAVPASGTGAGSAATAVPSSEAVEEPAPLSTAVPTSSSAVFDHYDITVPGERALARRFLLCVPKHRKPGERLPLLVLLHGLGETGDERLGAYAWVERYGLETAYDRLRRAPIERTSKQKYWTDSRLAEVNSALAKKPFSGMCIVCPYTPNVNKLPNPTGSLDSYASWVVDVVVPRARKDAPVHAGVAGTAIDGCSLGGYVALEVFLRKTASFAAFGGVQSAFGDGRAKQYADRLAAALAATRKPLHFLTSEGDPFLAGNRRVSVELARLGIPSDLRVLPGPHDQPWLREAGTIEMLLWHDRRWAAR